MTTCTVVVKMRGILAEFWLQKEMVNQQNGYHEPQFKANRGTTKGGLVLSTLFNVAVERVVCHCLSMTVDYYVVIHNGLGHEVGRKLGVLYTDNCLLGSQDMEWLQGDLNVIVCLFRRI